MDAVTELEKTVKDFVGDGFVAKSVEVDPIAELEELAQAMRSDEIVKAYDDEDADDKADAKAEAKQMALIEGDEDEDEDEAEKSMPGTISNAEYNVGLGLLSRNPAASLVAFGISSGSKLYQDTFSVAVKKKG